MKILCAPVGPLQGNCYLVADDQGECCVIDPGGEAQRLARVASERDLHITHILITHGHFDHLAGAADLAALTGALLVCSADTAPMLRRPDDYIPWTEFEGVPGREPNLIVKEGDELQVGDLEVRVIETPGHTPGDITFEIGGHLFCGDLLFYRSVGRTDFPGGDFSTLLASVQKLLDRYPSDTPVHPGHMQSTVLGAEAEHNPFLAGLGRGA